MHLAPMPAAPLRACGDASNRKPASPAARPAARRGDAFRAEPDRAAASRPCPCGAASPRRWPRRPAGASCCGSRISTPTRCRPEFAAAIEADLAWLGLDWDGPVRVQSAHMPDYRAALDRLAGRGLALSLLLHPHRNPAGDRRRPAHAPHGPDGPLYPGTCRRLAPAERAARIAAGEPHALRLDMAAALAVAPADLSFHELGEGRLRCDPAQFGDVVLARKETPASYHLCVTHDDALQGVTLVTRGRGPEAGDASAPAAAGAAGLAGTGLRAPSAAAGAGREAAGQA